MDLFPVLGMQLDPTGNNAAQVLISLPLQLQ